MFHVRDASRAEETQRTDGWLELARQLGTVLVEPPEGGQLHFSCWQLQLECVPTKGQLLSPCCRRQLLELLHAVMARCQEAGATCELQEGTLLGAVKLGTILPWERDADIAFSSADFDKLDSMKKRFSDDGFRWVQRTPASCCYENRTTGGSALVLTGAWQAELWGQHWMDTEKLRDQAGLPPTRVLLDGRWYPAPRNPGLYVRNRYGHEVYRHAEHWLTTGMKSGWAAYNTARPSKLDRGPRKSQPSTPWL
ncbi:uncharacterized protein LOC119108586 isoform X2 [Pollicipes pollicipes]|uniref:uncharacterized protein LOC119108586 isoform X2 n=1 Tax=Pollicipes pollicipes TaxID=41117 RepID=UPI00188539BB|nr:uncharacterized protein LOC119108586 isoform X2 [Pollicipes pollicipes]